MNREDISRIRLKISTTAGINILCTASKLERVSDWLPHFEAAYREVKEEQGDDQYSIQRFIRAVRVKKGDFHIANSEIIGDIFDDNDQVHCEIFTPNKKQGKAEKQKIKKGPKGKETREDILDEEKDQEEELQNQQKPKKQVKIEHQSNGAKEVRKQIKSSENKHANLSKPIVAQHSQHSPKSIKKQSSQQTSSPSKKHKLLQKIDFSKLKNILMHEEGALSALAKQLPSDQKQQKPHHNSKPKKMDIKQ